MTTPQRIALCYSRMSSGDTKEQLQRQADDIRDICRLAEYTIRPELCWSDEDESGNRDTRFNQRKKTIDPPGMLALNDAVQDLTAQGHHVVVVGWKSDRLFRDVGLKEDCFRFWARINAASDGDVPLVVVHTADAHWIPGVAADRLTSTVLTASNQHYSDAVREKVIRAHKQRRKDGKMGTGFGGFGYDPKPVRHKTLEKVPARKGENTEHRPGAGWTVNKYEARLIRKAAKELLAGKAALQIVREWQKADVPTSLGGQWTATSFRRAMTKPTLAGILVHRGKEIGKGDWEPILDEAILRQLQALFNRPLTRPRLSRGLLTGVLYCGHCEGFVRLHQNVKGSNPVKRVYGCNTCGKSNIDAEAVEAVYVERLWERLDDPRFRKMLNADDGSQAVLAEIAKHEGDKELLKASAEKISVDVYIAKAESIETELAQLRSQLEQCQRPSLGWLHDTKRLKRSWKTMDNGRQRALLLDVVGPSKVFSAGTSGRRATRQRVLDQLRLIEGPIPV